MAMEAALSETLVDTYNAGFLRENASLIVVLISDGVDCGGVGDVSEGLDGVDEKICAYAAKGVGPDGGFFHPDDPAQKEYALRPVAETYDFLMALKEGRPGMVKFAGIVGLADINNLDHTVIEYSDAGASSEVQPACVVPDCEGEHCLALPDPRVINLAKMFGLGDNGMVDTLCQEDFFYSAMRGSPPVGCPKRFLLRYQPLDSALIAMRLNGEPLADNACSMADNYVPCGGADADCGDGECLPSWRYLPPGDPLVIDAPGGMILFAPQIDLCNFEPDLETRFELTYVALEVGST